MEKKRQKSTYPLTNHMLEIKYRMWYSILCLALTFIVAYYCSEELMYLISKPLLLAQKSPILNIAEASDNMVGIKETEGIGTVSEISKKKLDYQINFIYTGLSEAFVTYMRIAFNTSIILVSPYIFYQIWLFLSPGLYYNEKQLLGFILMSSYLFFIIGILLAYYIIFPIAWYFFVSFEQASIYNPLNLHLEAKINEYIQLVYQCLLTFGLTFQFPIVIFFLLSMNILSEKFILTKRNYTCLLAFIIAALISPPDVISQILIVIPILLFYELTIFFIKLNNLYKKR